eukprot:scaffold37890_cov27-Phaeocystis_antarctica.AAC.1
MPRWRRRIRMRVGTAPAHPGTFRGNPSGGGATPTCSAHVQPGSVRKLSPDPHPRCPATTPRPLSTRTPAVRSFTALHPPPQPTGALCKLRTRF